MSVILKMALRYLENHPEKVEELIHALIDHAIEALKAQRADAETAKQ